MLRAIITILLLGFGNNLFPQEVKDKVSLIYELGVAVGSGAGANMHLNVIPEKSVIGFSFARLGAIRPSADSKWSRSLTLRYGRLVEFKSDGYATICIGPSMVKTGSYEHFSGWFGSGYNKSEDSEEDVGVQLDLTFFASKKSPSISLHFFLNINQRRNFGALAINIFLGKLKS